MHRKNIRRWPKLLSASGIIVTISGMIFVPMANAELGGPIPMGIYGASYSRDVEQFQYIDFASDVSGLDPTDLYITGTATGCQIADFATLSGFSFGIPISGCSDGDYRLHLRAESVTNSSGKTGPSRDFSGDVTVIDRSALEVIFEPSPSAFESSSVSWQITMNHMLYPTGSHAFSVSGDGCIPGPVTETNYGFIITADNCTDGATVFATIPANSIQDVFGNYGPSEVLNSAPVSVAIPVALPEPTPTTTDPVPTDPVPTDPATATPTPAPSVSAISTPTPRPSSSRSRASVPVVTVSHEPTPPPTSPLNPAPEPEPTAVVIQQPAKQETSIAPAPKAISQAAEQEQQPPAIAQPEVSIPPIQEPVLIESEPAFDWQPIGYLAITVGVAMLSVVGVLMFRNVRVRRLKFS